MHTGDLRVDPILYGSGDCFLLMFLVSFYSTWAVLETFGVQKAALGIDERRPPAHTFYPA